MGLIHFRGGAGKAQQLVTLANDIPVPTTMILNHPMWSRGRPAFQGFGQPILKAFCQVESGEKEVIVR